MENKLIIALVGRICAGKGVTSEYMAQKYGAAVLSFSDPMREMLKILHQDVNRVNLQKFSLAIRQHFGEEAFSIMIKGQALDRSENIIVLDPIRRPADIVAFDSGSSFVLVALKRDDGARYQSMVTRNREKSDSDVTREKFNELDNAETEIYINDLAAKADYTIENSGTIEDLYKKVDELMAKILKK